MAAAIKSSYQSNKSSGKHWQGKRDWGSINNYLKRGKPSTASSYKEQKIANMGSGGSSGNKPSTDKRLCYHSKSPDHVAKACPKYG